MYPRQPLSLLHPSEVNHYVDIDRDFPVCKLKFILAIERHAFLANLGKEFYTVLRDAKVDYSTVQEYKNDTAYAVGAKVVYKGIVYINIEASTGVPPSNYVNWELAPKFEGDCYNEFWCEYLAPYLSWLVVRDKLPVLLVQLKSEGLVKIFGNNFNAAGAKDYYIYQKHVVRKLDEAFDLLDDYCKTEHMKSNNNCFATYKGNEETSCGEPGHINPHEQSGFGWQVG